MRILIIGGIRFFGKRLVHLLLREGHDVTILSRGTALDDFGDLVRRLRVDRTKKSELKEVIGDDVFDVVVDQVCMTGQEARDSIETFTNKTSYYVMTSTLAVYEERGDLREEDFYSREFVPDHSNTYSSGKREAEMVFLETLLFRSRLCGFPLSLDGMIILCDYKNRLKGFKKACRFTIQT